MHIVTWEMPQALKDELNSHYKTRLAPLLKNGTPLGAIQAITFDGVAPHLTLEAVERFVDFIDTQFLSNGLRGVGLEVGSGPGTFTALLAKRKRVEKVYGVDACEAIVRELMPAVVSYLMPSGSEEKVVGAVGDFTHIGLPDASVDFVFDFFSLHHADDLGQTLREAARILKPGGFVFCFDKARDNNLSDQDLNAMLDREYSEAFKRTMGVDPTQKWTRRMNGEKEYRLKDWKKSFLENGFQAFEHFHIARIKSNNPLVKALKTLFSFLPARVQARITNLLPLKAQNNLSPDHRVYTALLNDFPKEISLMIAYK